MPSPLSPMFTMVSSSKNQFLDTHVMAVVTARREIAESPGTYVSAMGAVFAANSIHNQTRVSYEKEALPSFQLRSMVEAISAAYCSQAYLKAAGCQRLAIAIDRDMEWIARIVCKFDDLVDRAADDEARLFEFVRYPEQMNHLVEFIGTFEAVTGIKIQFWPTECHELSGAHVWADKAIDLAMSNYERDYYGVLDEEDYFDEDYYDEEEEYYDDVTTSDEEEDPEPKEVMVEEIDTNLEIITGVNELANALGAMDLNTVVVLDGKDVVADADADVADVLDETSDDEEEDKESSDEDEEDEEDNISMPATPPATTALRIMIPDAKSQGSMAYEKMADSPGMDFSPYPGSDGSLAFLFAQFSFGSTDFEEILLSVPFCEAAAVAVAANPDLDEPYILTPH